MKILKRVLLGLLALVILLLIVGLFTKKDYSVTRTVTINKPRSEVYTFISYLKNQNTYSKWGKMDPNMKISYTGTDATPGFISSWEGNKDVGTGEQEIKKVTPGQRVDYELRFLKPWKSVGQSYMSTDSIGPAQTKVTWGMQGKMPYPMNLMLVFMNMDKMVGNDLQIGLDNLKAMQEKN